MTTDNQPQCLNSADMTDLDTLIELGYSMDRITELPDGRAVINFKLILEELYGRTPKLR